MNLEDILTYSVSFILLYSIVFLLLLYLKNYNKIMVQKKFSGRNLPLISILISAYNEEKYVEKCLDCVLALDYPKDKLEIIVVNDGSTDRTAEIINSYRSKGIKLLNKKNSGKASSLNYAIPIAKGKIIATMDADSYVQPDVIKKLLPFFDEGGVVAVTSAVKVRSDNMMIKELQRLEYLLVLLSRKLLAVLDSVPVTPGPFSMFRAEIFRELGGFDEKSIVEDHEMALRIQYNNYKIRSSIDAVVYTEVPPSLKGLINQRVRWHRGGLHNLFKYRSLLSPKYGDFGMFVIPVLSLLPIVALLIMLPLAINSFINQQIYLDKVGWDLLFISFKPIAIIVILVFLAALLWIYLNVRAFKGEDTNPLLIAGYIIVYWYVTLAYNLITVFKELKREKLSW